MHRQALLFGLFSAPGTRIFNGDDALRPFGRLRVCSFRLSGQTLFFFFILLQIWNEFLWPLIITNSDKSRPLTADLVRFTQLGEIGAQWPLFSAATLMVIAPLFIVFLIFQRRFIQSFMHSGIK